MIDLLIVSLLFCISLEYLVVKTTYKYRIPEIYKGWRYALKEGTLLDRILPEEFCLMCFITQTSFVVSLISVIILPIPFYYLFTHWIITASLVLKNEIIEHR